jgi:hypothetical protein
MVFVSRDGKNFFRCEDHDFQNEEEFREILMKLVEKNMDIILPVAEAEEPPRLVFLKKEFRVPSGLIDLLGIDDEGCIYLVETKLYKSSQRRRALTQAIEYASALWSEYSRNPDAFIAKLKEGSSIAIEEGILKSIKENVMSGYFRLIVAMDRIEEAMKKIINFLNETCEFDVYGLSLERYRSKDGVEVVIPKLFPSSPPTATTESRKRRQWNEESFFKDVDEKVKSEEVRNAIRKIYNFSKEKADEISWGTGPAKGSFSPKFQRVSRRSVYTVRSDGSLTINFGWLNDDEDTLRWREKLCKKLGEITKNYITSETIEKWPSIPPEIWAPRVDDFISAITELLEEA